MHCERNSLRPDWYARLEITPLWYPPLEITQCGIKNYLYVCEDGFVHPHDLHYQVFSQIHELAHTLSHDSHNSCVERGFKPLTDCASALTCLCKG